MTLMDAVNYKNGAKNQWRRTVWNLIRVHAKPGVILYLPGSTDLDRDEALRRGFKPADLIAIERDPEVARSLRERGVTTIRGSLNDVLESWPPHVPIAALLADLQCGFDPWVERLAEICAQHPAMAEAVVVANLQRGRDAYAKTFSALTADNQDLVGGEGAADKSRGKTFALVVVASVPVDEMRVPLGMAGSLEQQWAQIETFKREVNRLAPAARNAHDFSKEIESMLQRYDALKARYEVELERCFQKVYHLPPYRSTPSSPYFDSCILPMRGRAEVRLAGWVAAEGMRPQIAAALAIRSRRLKGELGGGHRRAA